MAVAADEEAASRIILMLGNDEDVVEGGISKTDSINQILDWIVSVTKINLKHCSTTEWWMSGKAISCY